MDEERTAERWTTPEHECPYCGLVQLDGWSEKEWQCKECKKFYKLKHLDDEN